MRNPFLTLIFENLHGNPLNSKMDSHNVHIKRFMFNEIQKGQNHEKCYFCSAVWDKQSIYFTTIPQSPWQQSQIQNGRFHVLDRLEGVLCTNESMGMCRKHGSQIQPFSISMTPYFFILVYHWVAFSLIFSALWYRDGSYFCWFFGILV